MALIPANMYVAALCSIVRLAVTRARSSPLAAMPSATFLAGRTVRTAAVAQSRQLSSAQLRKLNLTLRSSGGRSFTCPRAWGVGLSGRFPFSDTIKLNIAHHITDTITELDYCFCASQPVRAAPPRTRCHNTITPFLGSAEEEGAAKAG